MKQSRKSNERGSRSHSDGQLSQLLTKQDVVRATKFSRRKVEDWMSKGELPYLRFGPRIRFSAIDVEDFIEAHRAQRALDPFQRSISCDEGGLQSIVKI